MFEFAKTFELPILQVVEPKGDADWQGYTEHGIAVNSGFLDGHATAEAKAKMIDWLEAEEKGSRQINFKLRDWLFSRQRYWGEPFPLLWDKETGEHAALPESELPLLQPEMEDFKPTGDPRGPLMKQIRCPSGQVRVGIISVTAIQRTQTALFPKKRRTTGQVRTPMWISTWVGRSTRSCISFTPVSGIRFSLISAISQPTSLSKS